jgi:membrane-associated phospholipid phosphatase
MRTRLTEFAAPLTLLYNFINLGDDGVDLKIYRPAIIFFLLVGLVATALLLPPGYLTRALAHIVTHRSLLVLLIIFALLALSLLWTAGHDIDLAGFVWFNRRGVRPPWLDGFMWGVTQLGSGLATLLLAVVFFFIHQRRLSFSLILGMITLSITVETIKALTERSRPFIHALETRVIGAKARGLSFPSGHTAQTFFLSSLFVNYFRLGMWGGLMLFSLAAVVGVTRMYVGAHYPRDVLAGAILGSVWGIVTGIIVS